MLDDCLTHYQHGTNRTLDALADDPKGAAALFAALDKVGLRDVSSERLGGTTAIVVRSSPDEVLRVCKEGLESERDAKDFRIWQPSQDLGSMAGYKVELYSKAQPLDKALQAGKISSKEAFELTQQLVGECAREGKLLWDLKPDNLTLAHDKGGKPVLFVLDEGALAPMAQMHMGVIAGDGRTNMQKFVDEMSDLAKAAGVSDASLKANPEGYLTNLKNAGQDVPDREAIQKSYHPIRIKPENKDAPLLTSPMQHGGFVARFHKEKLQREQAAPQR